VPERSPDEIQREIEHARDDLATAVDQIAYRTNPKRLSDQAKVTLREKAQSDQGRMVIAGVGVLVLVYLVWRVRR
jgi:hypothetical protein